MPEIDENGNVITEENTDNSENNANTYLENIKKLKANSVDKREYEKLLAERNALANSIAEGDFSEHKDPENEVDYNIDELRNSVLKKGTTHQNNLQYFENVLKLRDAVIKTGGNDPFVPVNSEYTPNEEDYEEAQFVAEQIQECIDFAQGDSKLFTNELQRRCGGKKK